MNNSPMETIIMKNTTSSSSSNASSFQDSSSSSSSRNSSNSSSSKQDDDDDDVSSSSSSEEEGLDGYKPGGYHPVNIGEVYNSRYKVLSKLGWGHFSTVWCCYDSVNESKVAMKVQKSAKHYMEASKDEIEFYTFISSKEKESDNIVLLLDSFIHKGLYGKHMCMVFECMSGNLLTLIKEYAYRGLPEELVKSITKDVLLGLKNLHLTSQIIHTDLKPENILFRYLENENEKKSDDDGTESADVNKGAGDDDSKKSAEDTTESGVVESTSQTIKKGSEKKRNLSKVIKSKTSNQDKMETLSTKVSNLKITPTPSPITYVPMEAKIADLGNACFRTKHFSEDIQTRQYRSPEVILGQSYDTPADLWSMGCTVFELLTGDVLFEPKSGKGFLRDEDHLAQFQELLGKIPKKCALAGKHARKYFNAKGSLKHIQRLNYWGLETVMHEKYHYPEQKAKMIASFLVPMLNFNSKTRATAHDCLHHPWLAGI